MQEPAYDSEKLTNDIDYFFEMVQVFQDYLDGLADYEEKVMYFMQMTSAMGKEPPMLNIATLCFERNGQKVQWGLPPYSNNQQKNILHKLYFEYYYRTSRTYFINKPRPEFDKLYINYLSQKRTERYRLLQLDWVTDEINTLQELINNWVSANPDRYTPEVKRQILKASVLIERELEDIPAIKWDVFYRSLHLDPFALLWGLVEYKRFLEISVPKQATTNLENKTNIDTFDAAPYCQTEVFRSDISELCNTCKLGQFIKEGIQKQIVFQAEQQKQILTVEQFREYCALEIVNAQKAMMKINFSIRKHEMNIGYKANFPNNTLVHIWNKECIKALNALQGIVEQKKSSIHILSHARPALLNELLQYVDNYQHESLIALINEDKEPSEPIICNCEQVRIGEIFYERVRAEQTKDRTIQADKTKLAKWICQHFVRKWQSSIVKKLSESTILNYLKGRGFSNYQ